MTIPWKKKLHKDYDQSGKKRIKKSAESEPKISWIQIFDTDVLNVTYSVFTEDDPRFLKVLEGITSCDGQVLLEITSGFDNY